MLVNQFPRLRRYQRQNSFLHEFAVPGIELAPGMTRQRLQLKIQKLMYIQRSGFILLVEFDILRFVHFSVEHALLNQELRPLEIAITSQKRIVEVKQRQIHDAACNNSRTSGTVTLRWLASE